MVSCEAEWAYVMTISVRLSVCLSVGRSVCLLGWADERYIVGWVLGRMGRCGLFLHRGAVPTMFLTGKIKKRDHRQHLWKAHNVALLKMSVRLSGRPHSINVLASSFNIWVVLWIRKALSELIIQWQPCIVFLNNFFTELFSEFKKKCWSLFYNVEQCWTWCPRDFIKKLQTKR